MAVVVDLLACAPGDPAFAPDLRFVVARAFRAGFGFDGWGPPWRLVPAERLPSRKEWLARLDF